jgi:hypothetical protein
MSTGAACNEQGKETAGSDKGGEYFDHLSDYKLLTVNCGHLVSYACLAVNVGAHFFHLSYCLR